MWFNSKVSDLSAEALARFRKEAAKNNRVDEDVLQDSDEELLKNLRLIDFHTHQLQRGALMLFHPDPERFVSGASIKLGFFAGADDDLVFQDEIHGPLMLQVDKVVTLLKERYLIYAISYEGTHRRETLQYPEEALRESILNAIAHKDYTTGVPIQISVYPDHLCIWNPGQLPETWTVAKLFEKHSSHPWNPALANAFFRSGDIESWGRGYRRIVRHMTAAKLLPPSVETDGGLMVTYYSNVEAQAKALHLDERQKKVLELVLKNGRVSNGDVQDLLGVSRATALRIIKSLDNVLEVKGEGGKYQYYEIRTY